jgi:uncharacterized membrane protein
VSGASGFDVAAAFKFGWAKFTANALPILLIMLVLVVSSVIVSFIGSSITSSMNEIEFNPDTLEFEGGGGFFSASYFVGFLFNALTWIVQTIVGAALIKGALDLTSGKPLSVSSMITGVDFVQVVIAAVLVGIATFIGLVLCILPGIAVIFLTWFTTFFIVGKGMNAIEAIKASVSFVTGNFASMALLLLASMGALIVGAIACLVGLLVAYPVVLIAQAYSFRVLNGEQVAP